MTKMATKPIYGKNLLRIRMAIIETWYIALGLSTTKFVQMMTLKFTLA